MQPATCPHCGLQTTAAALGRHAPICLHDPANLARVTAQLTDYDDVGITYSEYQVRVAQYGAPGVTTLRRLTGFNAWDDVLAYFGLQSPVAPASVRTCPVCGKTFKALGYAHHYRKCSGGEKGRAIAQEVTEESALIEQEARILHRDMLQAQCLPVYAPHPAKGGGVGYYVR
jgi:endogenous inhibitor of DNA gyrase (YacG/DUF329 family)